MASDEKKAFQMKGLKILLMNVYGMEMKRTDRWSKPVSTGRRVREVWKDEGKDQEGRREWERR